MTKTGVKREWDASEIETSDVACVHGIVTSLSPVMKSRENNTVQYFHGELRDGKKNCYGVISFYPSLHIALKQANDSEKLVAVSS